MHLNATPDRVPPHRPRNQSPVPPPAPPALLALGSAAGNRAVQRLLQAQRVRYRGDGVEWDTEAAPDAKAARLAGLSLDQCLDVLVLLCPNVTDPAVRHDATSVADHVVARHPQPWPLGRFRRFQRLLTDAGLTVPEAGDRPLDVTTPGAGLALLGRGTAPRRVVDHLAARHPLATWGVGDLHTLLDHARTAGDTDLVDEVERAVRAAVPPVDTDRRPPHRKTPDGGTRVLHVNYPPRGDDAAVDRVRFVLATARRLGLHVRVLTTADGWRGLGARLDLAGAEPVVVSGAPSRWTQDSVEFLETGQPVVHHELFRGATPTQSGLLAGRHERWAGLVPPAFRDERFDDRWVPMGLAVAAGDATGRLWEEAARERGRPAGHLRAYVEGGNAVTGEDAAGRTVVLVGRDAVAVTRAVYRLADDAEVRALIAEDFGLAHDQVLLVEQPGKFHLDMGLLFAGRGRVVVNDSKPELARARERASAPDSRWLAALELRCRLEDQAADDLRAGHMVVHRARFEKAASHNFFNGLFVTGRGGTRCYITNGTGDAGARAAFEAFLVDELHAVDEVVYTSPEAAGAALGRGGGISCLVKGGPEQGWVVTTGGDPAALPDRVRTSDEEPEDVD
ncbi:hypothetical protein [Saccharothrix obliqua]|uniref:hypothetical protein n=1 Tax=Saccharothrix obliqua TaxID=2861747 RepID=UPI001C607896|nr:hypothetical protein [Saccharothrix obliqua]MBW4719445.1 hypothetical protein [Saccharothrix obliqua]